MSDTLQFLYRQFFLTPAKTTSQQANLRGHTGIVTGSNVGLGLEASRQLLEVGLSHLILAVRNKSKGENARRDLQRTSPKAKIEVWELNMSSYESITQFTQKCATLARLDFAILNAGVFKTSLEINNSTSYEEVFQVNYLSTALLTIQLLPILDNKNTSRSRPGTITIVGSETAEWAKLKEQEEEPMFPAFNNPKFFDMQERYYSSKLLEEFFMVKLCRFLPSSKGVVNVVNPGFCYGSELHTEVTGPLGFVFGIYKRLIGRSTSIGARTLVNAAVAQGPGSHGQYLSDNRLYPLAPQLEGKKGAQTMEKLWRETMDALSFAKAEEIVRQLRGGDIPGKQKGDYLR